MGQRPRWFDPLLFEGDGGRFVLPDPDRQIPIAVDLPQQEDRLVLRLFDTNPYYPHLAHRDASVLLLVGGGTTRQVLPGILVSSSASVRCRTSPPDGGPVVAHGDEFVA